MLISEVIKELEAAKEKIGDVGVYVFHGQTLSLKVEVLEEADMVIIRNKSNRERKEEAKRVQVVVPPGFLGRKE